MTEVKELKCTVEADNGYIHDALTVLIMHNAYVQCDVCVGSLTKKKNRPVNPIGEKCGGP